MKEILNKVGYLFLLLLIGLLLLGAGRESRVTKKYGVNLLYLGNGGMAVVSVRPGQELASMMKLPDELLIPLTTTGAEYTIEGYRKVGVSENNSLKLTKDSVARSLGINIDAIVRTKTYGSSLEDLLSSLWQLNLETNLSLLDRYRLYEFLKPSVDRHNYLTINLPTKVMDEVEEIDGKRLLRLNAAVYAWVRNQWVHEELLNESADIVVINASETPGMGRTVARQLEAAGGRVVDVLPSNRILKGKCKLAVDKKAYPALSEYISMVYGCENEKKLEVTDWSGVGVGAEVVLVIGKGFLTD